MDSAAQRILRVEHPLARGAFFATWFLVVANLIDGNGSPDPVENVITALVGGPFAGWTVALAVGTLVSVVSRLRRATGPDGESDQEDSNTSNAQDDVVPKQPRLAQIRTNPALLVTLGVVTGLVVGVVGALAIADRPGDAEPKVVDTYCSPRIKTLDNGVKLIEEGVGVMYVVLEDGTIRRGLDPGAGEPLVLREGDYSYDLFSCRP